jgi:hypothetical protein
MAMEFERFVRRFLADPDRPPDKSIHEVSRCQ